MNPQAEEQIRNEKIRVFELFLNSIKSAEEKLKDEFEIARNYACADLKLHNGELDVSRLYPGETKRLHQNFSLMQEKLSRQKYFVIKAFLPELEKLGYPLSQSYRDCLEYWDKELAKEDPNFHGRFFGRFFGIT